MPAEKESRIVNYGTAGGAAAPIHSLTRGWIRITRSTIEPRKKDSHRSRPRPRRRRAQPAIQTGGGGRKEEEARTAAPTCGRLFPRCCFFCFRCRFCSVRFEGEEDGDGELSRVACAYKGRGFPDPATRLTPLAGASGTRGDPFPPFNYSCFVL
jgi:hypothetical protein